MLGGGGDDGVSIAVAIVLGLSIMVILGALVHDAMVVMPRAESRDPQVRTTPTWQ